MKLLFFISIGFLALASCTHAPHSSDPRSPASNSVMKCEWINHKKLNIISPPIYLSVTEDRKAIAVTTETGSYTGFQNSEGSYDAYRIVSLGFSGRHLDRSWKWFYDSNTKIAYADYARGMPKDEYQCQ